MSLAKLQRFIQYLRGQDVMKQEDVLRAVKQMSVFDRRLGHLGAFRGFIQPEDINTILLEQARSGDRFGECAVRLKLMNPQQIDMLIKLQKDDLFLFAQAAVTQKLTTTDKIVSHIRSFLGANPDMAREAEAPPSIEKIGIDRQVRSILQGIEKISPLPATAQRAVSMLEDPDVDLDKVGGVLILDPGLTATLLRVVNSAFYGLREKVTGVTKALVVLGLKKIRQLIIAAAVMQKFQSIPPAFAQKFWEDSLRCAQWSKELGEALRMEESDELFVCGLLHNTGHLVTMQYFRPQQNEIDEMVRGGKRMVDAEKSVLGGSHADVGGFLFNLWQMPKDTIQSAMFHHHDLQLLVNSPNLSPAVFVVHMAADICDLDPKLDALGYMEELEKISKRYQAPLKFRPDMAVDRLAEQVDTHFGNLLTSFTEWK
ncbi:MAG: hypothetical protein A3G34_05460 [Candidatus Lindowbacteria bacterium RIFCSPLOWO2_12_FULL_62_27]|nr:MAG: hypothetical protein A3G34_05460 [Candidatus Lindowbacteria bacterium RIFCSPLOWO2_12_FULL_62_27]OGH63759.1 MAG: hypothetical protein A3I06_10700 [Candidatus Lindowbacteria bacterium RIFCSPLOWO2_02_FULL_62_12]